MAKLAFKFTPFPDEFLTDEFLEDVPMMKIIRYILRRISPESTKINLKNRKSLTLDPYEFMFGRNMCCKETNLTERQVRSRIDQLNDQQYIKKTTSKTTSTFTVYKLLSKRFKKINVQQNVQHISNKNDQQNDHNLDIEIKRTKKDHHPYPSSSASPSNRGDEVTDDFSSFEEGEKIIPIEPISLKAENEDSQHNIYYQDEPHMPSKGRKSEDKIEYIPGQMLSQAEIEACLALKGSHDAVKHAMEYVLRSPGRKCKIYDWPNTLAKWVIKSDIKPRLKEHQEMGKRIVDAFGQCAQVNSNWRCEFHRDKIKDQNGVLFFPVAGQDPTTIFVAFSDAEFREKANKVLRDKKMQIGRIS